MISPLFVDRSALAGLRHWIDSTDTAPALHLRARIVLLCSEGWGPSAIARELACSKQTVITWRERYRVSGMAGLTDGLRSGRPPKMDARMVIRRTLESPGLGTKWSTRSLGAELGLSNVAVANIWRRWGVKPLMGGRVLLTTDPVLDAPVTALVGLHIDPPLHVLAVVTGDPSASRPCVSSAVDLAWWPPDLDGNEPAGPADPARAADLARRIVRGWRDGAASGASPMRLVAAGDAEALLDAIPGDATTLHAAEDVLSWQRVVAVCCLMAGSSASGAASVDSVREALSRSVPGGPFTWTNDALLPSPGDNPEFRITAREVNPWTHS